MIKMRLKTFLKDIATVSAGNVLYLLSNILVGFVLPALLGVEDYGYYKLFTLYLGYSGLLNFGFLDGVLLHFGGKEYQALDKKQLRLLSRFFILLEIAIGIMVIVFSFVVLEAQYRYIFFFVGINMALNNITQYYQYLSQAVSRFKEFAARKTIQAIGLVLIVLLLGVWTYFIRSGSLSFLAYLVPLQVLSFVLLLWYVFTYREITFGERQSLLEGKKTLKVLFKKGVVLMISYEVSRLILLIDQQFVSLLFNIQVYAQYAFAYNILSCVTTVITAISVVLFPKLKAMEKEEALKLFSTNMALVSGIVCFCLNGYYPVQQIVKVFLPDYIDSLVYFQVIFPALALSSCISIVSFSYYNVFEKSHIYLRNSIIILPLSVALNILAYAIFKTPVAISVASVLTTIVWYLLSVRYLSKQFRVAWKKNFLYVLLMMSIFYITTTLLRSNFLSALVYFVFYALLTYSFFLRHATIGHIVKRG